MRFTSRTFLKDAKKSREGAQSHFRDWLWVPWYAKLWWLGIAIFWAVHGVVSSLHLDIAVIDGAFGDYASMIFNPITAALSLSVGPIRNLLINSDRHVRRSDDTGVHRREDAHVIPLRSSLLHPNRADGFSNPVNPLSPFDKHH